MQFIEIDKSAQQDSTTSAEISLQPWHVFILTILVASILAAILIKRQKSLINKFKYNGKKLDNSDLPLIKSEINWNDISDDTKIIFQTIRDTSNSAYKHIIQIPYGGLIYKKEINNDDYKILIPNTSLLSDKIRLTEEGESKMKQIIDELNIEIKKQIDDFNNQIEPKDRDKIKKVLSVISFEIISNIDQSITNKKSFKQIIIYSDNKDNILYEIGDSTDECIVQLDMFSNIINNSLVLDQIQIKDDKIKDKNHFIFERMITEENKININILSEPENKTTKIEKFQDKESFEIKTSDILTEIRSDIIMSLLKGCETNHEYSSNGREIRGYLIKNITKDELIKMKSKFKK